MPSGIIMQSGSVGATKEAIEKVLADNGYETETPAETPVELKREDFESDEAFEDAQEAHEEKIAAEKEAKDEEEQEAARPKPLTRKQRAIDRATRQLQEDNRKLAERLAQLEGKKVEAAPKLETPKRESFKTDAEFEEAMFDHRYKLRRAKEEYDNAQKAVTDRLKANFESYQSQVEEFKEKHDDWDEVVNQQIPIHESVYLAVQEQKNGAQVTYYLGKHPDYARALSEMSPLSAVMEVGRLAERLKTGARAPREADSGVTRKPRTRLPEPVKPVSTSATNSTLTSSEAAKKRDFRAFKAAQRAGR